MKLNFVHNFQQGVVEILIYDEIGRNPETGKGISGAMLASEILWLDANSEIDLIKVRINSPGGALMEGINIFNAIRNCTTPTETHIDGVAASSAGIIAMAGKKRYINDFARLMVHAPSVPDAVEMNDETKNTLASFQSLIIQVLTANSKCSEKKVKSFVERETWFDAKEALALGFVDGITNTGRDLEMIMNELSGLYMADEVFNTVTNFINNNSTQMSKLNLVRAKLGLDSATTEDQILEAVTNLSNQKTALEADKASLAGEVSNLKAQLAVSNKTAAESVVDGAIKAGKFDATKREALVAQAVQNLESFKDLIDSISTPAANVKNHIDSNDESAATGKVIDGKFEGKTYREWEKSNPSAIKNLMKNDPKVHGELFKAQYGTEYKS